MHAALTQCQRRSEDLDLGGRSGGTATRTRESEKTEDVFIATHFGEAAPTCCEVTRDLAVLVVVERMGRISTEEQCRFFVLHRDGSRYASVQQPMIVAATLMATLARVSDGLPNCAGSSWISTVRILLSLLTTTDPFAVVNAPSPRP